MDNSTCYYSFNLARVGPITQRQSEPSGKFCEYGGKVVIDLPVSRCLKYLLGVGNYNAYNPALASVMCRSTLHIGRDGQLYDCDFNQVLKLPLTGQAPRHIREFYLAALNARSTVVHQPCYGCTAGVGSSGGGATT